MNILQLITPSRISGAERSTVSLCEHLQAAGHHVVVGCKEGSPLLPVMQEAGLDARPVAISGKANLLAPFRIAALAREVKAEVIHTQLSTAAWHGAFAGRLLRLPVVAHVRALNSAFCYRGATRVIAISRGIKEHLVAQGLPGARIDVVYNGIDPDRYYLPCPRLEARRRLGLPEEGPLVGVVAHLTAKKGHDLFLQAFRRATWRYPEARAVFVGEGAEREALQSRVRELGLSDRVSFAGFQPDVLPYYAAMDVVVLPSTDKEGLGRALQEGGLLGLPQIGSRLGGIPECIWEGETGFTFPVGDVPALTECLDRLLADPALRERMGQSAKRFVAETFTVQAMVAGVLATYARAGAISRPHGRVTAARS
ncbi:MAG: glycosyltransferase [Armatimonadota bacterium]